MPKQAIALVLLFTVGSPAEGQVRDNSVAQQNTPDFSFDAADATASASLLGGPLLYDGDLTTVGDRLWGTWLEFTPGKGDAIWVGVRDGKDWGHRQRITPEHAEFAAPTLTVDAKGRLWLSYEARRDDQWHVFLTPLVDGKPAGKTHRVSQEAGSNIHHHAVAAGAGLWFFWQSDRGGQFDVIARQWVSGEFQDPQVIGNSLHGDWHPRAAADSHGGVHAVWDSYNGTSFNVQIRSFQQGRWGDTTPVADSAAFEGRADVAVDNQNRVWIAWEQGGENWGRPFRGIRTETLRDHLGPLHRYRLLHFAVRTNDGALHRLDDSLPMPSVNRARRRLGRNPGIEQTGAFYERVKLAVDAAGRIWLAYRHYYTPWLGVAHRTHVEQGWGVYARCYTAEGWSPLMRASVGQGDGMQRLTLTPHENGIAALWTTGRTHRRAAGRNQEPASGQNAKKTNRPRGLAATMFTTPGDPPGELALTEIETAKTAQESPPSRRDDSKPNTISVGGKTYYLFYGDLHRHTDLSLCRVPIDGTIDDAYRYAIEVARLDFLGITDHSRDLARGDPLSQLWWRSRKEVYRHQLGAAGNRRFMPLYAYERSHGNTADHNVISLRGDMLRSYAYPVPKFWRELDADTMTIPHQPVRRDTWNYQNDRLRPVVEIYQGCRDASIEEEVRRGLAKGYHLGFIASSDHMSTSASYACVWAEQPTRESIFRALQARRTFAATDKSWLTVQAGDHWMGEVIEGKTATTIKLQAHSAAPIRSIDLIVDGKTHRTYSPNQRRVNLEERLEVKGKRYAYFHLRQSDGNQAWSSPLWFE